MLVVNDRLGPALPKANVDNLIVRHGAGQVADGLCECVHVSYGFLGDDGIVKLDIALDRAHYELRRIRWKLALPDLPREGRIVVQHALCLDDGPHGGLDAIPVAFEIGIGRRQCGKGEMAHVGGVIAAPDIDEDLSGAAIDDGFGAQRVPPEAIDQPCFQRARSRYPERHIAAACFRAGPPGARSHGLE